MPSMRLELASLLGGILRNAREHKFIISTLEDIQQLRSTFASLSADYQTRKRTRQEYALSVFFNGISSFIQRAPQDPKMYYCSSTSSASFLKALIKHRLAQQQE